MGVSLISHENMSSQLPVWWHSTKTVGYHSTPAECLSTPHPSLQQWLMSRLLSVQQQHPIFF